MTVWCVISNESCWSVEQGDVFPTKEDRRKLLKTVNGEDLCHHGEKDVTAKYDSGESKDPTGLKFQVTDVPQAFAGCSLVGG